MLDNDSEHGVRGTTIERATALAEMLSASLVKEIDIRALGMPSKLPFKAVTVRELLAHRLAELSVTAVELFKSGRVVSAILLTRAALETTSTLFVLSARIHESLKRRDLSGVDESLMKMLFGGRSEMAPERAINVLSHLDKMDKKYEGTRWWYDELSEYTHPNFPGLMGSYGNIDEEEFIVHLGINERTEEAGIKFGVSALCSCLEVAVYIYNQMGGPLGEFCLLCHEQAGTNVEHGQGSAGN
jgi:hypothetical protein